MSINCCKNSFSIKKHDTKNKNTYFLVSKTLNVQYFSFKCSNTESGGRREKGLIKKRFEIKLKRFTLIPLTVFGKYQ